MFWSQAAPHHRVIHVRNDPSNESGDDCEDEEDVRPLFC